MGTDAGPSDAGRHYSRVQEDHGDQADLRGALRAYEQLIAAHPEAPEAALAREWIRRIHALRVRLADGREIPMSDVLAHRWDPPAGPRE